MLEKCAAIDFTIPTFINAFKAFENGTNAVTIRSILSKAPRFKAAIATISTGIL